MLETRNVLLIITHLLGQFCSKIKPIYIYTNGQWTLFFASIRVAEGMRAGTELAGAEKATSERSKVEDLKGSPLKKHKKHKKHKSKKKRKNREKEGKEIGLESDSGTKDHAR